MPVLQYILSKLLMPELCLLHLAGLGKQALGPHMAPGGPAPTSTTAPIATLPGAERRQPLSAIQNHPKQQPSPNGTSNDAQQTAA